MLQPRSATWFDVQRCTSHSNFVYALVQAAELLLRTSEGQVLGAQVLHLPAALAETLCCGRRKTAGIAGDALRYLCLSKSGKSACRAVAKLLQANSILGLKKAMINYPAITKQCSGMMKK